MSVIALRSAEIYKGNTYMPKNVWREIKASQTFKAKEFLKDDASSNEYVEGVATGATAIKYFALEDGQLPYFQGESATSKTAGTKICVLPIDPSVKFIMNIYKTGDLSNAVTAKTQIGQKYGIVIVSNKVHVDLAQTQNLAVEILDLYTDEGDAVGDQYGRVIVRFIPQVIQGFSNERLAIPTAGTAPAHTAVCGLTQLLDGQEVIVDITAVGSSGDATFNPDGLGAKAMVKASNVNDTVAYNDLTAGRVYKMMYDSSLVGAAGAWVVWGL